MATIGIAIKKFQKIEKQELDALEKREESSSARPVDQDLIRIERFQRQQGWNCRLVLVPPASAERARRGGPEPHIDAVGMEAVAAPRQEPDLLVARLIIGEFRQAHRAASHAAASASAVLGILGEEVLESEERELVDLVGLQPGLGVMSGGGVDVDVGEVGGGGGAAEHDVEAAARAEEVEAQEPQQRDECEDHHDDERDDSAVAEMEDLVLHFAVVDGIGGIELHGSGKDDQGGEIKSNLHCQEQGGNQWTDCSIYLAPSPCNWVAILVQLPNFGFSRAS
ncbi:hypothetical protein SELMODRAFT_449162 [Selaginella moellendorffii]|uniref:Uncharacterized protein n=1 Tax=Selaginella moellendorffii TaxID=88036 RepID=D8TD87_SELML|nr:hypothetical protein SELMODRAFT_449162 [Selaginella moellendorffii]